MVIGFLRIADGFEAWEVLNGNPTGFIDPFGLGPKQPYSFSPTVLEYIGAYVVGGFEGAFEGVIGEVGALTGGAIDSEYGLLGYQNDIIFGLGLDPDNARFGTQAGQVAITAISFAPVVSGVAAARGAAVAEGGIVATERVAIAAKGTAFRAINPAYAESTAQSGFFRSGAAGRLGNDGIYASSTVEGAIAEFQFHNPGIDPAVFRVQYPASPMLNISPPSGYFNQPLPFTGDANILTAPSLRAPGTMNLLIREGAVPAGRIQ